MARKRREHNTAVAINGDEVVLDEFTLRAPTVQPTGTWTTQAARNLLMGFRRSTGRRVR